MSKIFLLTVGLLLFILWQPDIALAQRPKPKPVPVATPVEDVPSLDALRQTVEHVLKLSKDQQLELKGVKEENITLKAEATGTKQELMQSRIAHATALGKADGLQTAIDKVVAWGNQMSEERKYWKDKHGEAVKKLWWWRLWGWAAIIISFVILAGTLLLKFTSWGARTIGPIVGKVASQFIVP